MACNWCQDKNVARTLITILCGEDRESWQAESNSDLCYCTPCVREYHKTKEEYIKENPECEEILYKMEEERLINHFGELLNQKGYEMERNHLSDDNEDYLKVPSLEFLRYPYLLFNNELMNLFVECLVLLIDNGKFHEIDEKLPGVYLLLVNPRAQVRKWALKTAKELGTISLEDYHCLSPVINCMLKILLYGLDNFQMDSQIIPMSAINENTNPLPHLHHPLPKKDLWLGFDVIFNALEDDVIRILLNQQGHRQVLGILKNMLECGNPDSLAAFWPVLFCLKVLMTKLESTFWLLTDFDDAPRTMFHLIINHVMYTKELNSLSAKSFQTKQEAPQDEVTLSQLAEEDDNDELNTSEPKACELKSREPFFWMLPYITTILDLDELCATVTCNVVEYLLSLIRQKTTFGSNSLPTELDYFILKCLCDILKYLVDRKLIFVIKTVSNASISVIFRLRFQTLDWNNEEPPRRWLVLMRKAQSIMVAMLNQAMNLNDGKNLADFYHWLRLLVPGRACDNRMIVKLERLLPGILRTLSKARQPGLSVADLDNSRLFSFSSEEDFKEEKKDEKVTNFVEYNAVCTVRKGNEGTSESPICISDSDDETETYEGAANLKGKNITASTSHNEDLGTSKENDYETIGFENNEESINNANRNKESSGAKLPAFCVPKGVNSEEEVFDGEINKVKGEVNEAKGESGCVEGEGGEAEDKNGEAVGGHREVEGEGGMLRGEKGYERPVLVVKASKALEIPDNNKYKILTGRSSPVAYDRNKVKPLVKDCDMKRSSDIQSGECKGSNLIEKEAKINDAKGSQMTFPNVDKDRNMIAAYKPDKSGDAENKKKEERFQREKSLKRPSLFQNEKSGNINSKKGCADSIKDRKSGKLKKTSVPKVELFEGHKEKEGLGGKQSYLETENGESLLKCLNLVKEKLKDGKRKILDNVENGNDAVHKKIIKANVENVRGKFYSAIVNDTCEKVRYNEDTSHREMLGESKPERSTMKRDKNQSESCEKKNEKKSPLERKGLFDFIGDLQQTSNDNPRNDEVFQNVESVSIREKIHTDNKVKDHVLEEVIEEGTIEVREDTKEVKGEVREEVKGVVREEVRGEVIEEVKGEVGKEVKGIVREEVKGVAIEENREDIRRYNGQFRDGGVTVDQNKETAKKISSEAFQRRKSILYDKCVKEQKLRALADDNRENAALNGVSRSPEKNKMEDKGHATQETGKSSEKVSATLHERLPEVQKHKTYTRDSLLQYILSWCPVWMANEQQDELSITLPHQPKMVKNKYNSYDEYMNTMWPLILIEFFARMTREYKERGRKPFDYKFKSFDPVIESKNFRIIICESLQEKNTDGVTRDPAENDLVILRFADEHTYEIFGVVEETERTSLSDKEDPKGSFSYTLISSKIKVANSYSGMKFPCGESFQIEIVTSMVSLFREWDALTRMHKSFLFRDILAPFRPQVFELANGVIPNDASSDLAGKYNHSQWNAISKITEAVVQAYPLPKVRMLQGPPGTGKTHTLKGLVKNILQSLPVSKNQNEKPRILICAASNAAVDEIVDRLKQDPPLLKENKKNSSKKKPNCGDFNMLRIGSKSQDSKVEKLTLDYLVNNQLPKTRHSLNALKPEINEVLRRLRELDTACTKLKMSGDKSKHTEKMKERGHLQRRYEDLQKQSKIIGTNRDLKEEEKRLKKCLLTGAHIICCTLSGAGSPDMVTTFRTEWNIRQGDPFACVIIDEAAQCCEPEALIPLQYGSSKLVLIGDPAQLPATVFSTRAKRYGYGQSLFERIQLAFSEHAESPVLMLQEQYRMNPEICAFPSQKFYNGKLLTASEVLQRKVNPEIKPMVVLNLKSSQETNESNGRIHNPEERKYVLHICKEIVKRGISVPENIGVITPYRKQLQKLRCEMNDGLLKKVEVNTIDGFQGREKVVIILSCVRARNGQFGIGFLEDVQRMNVALTRAKHSLILIVHAHSLQVDADWKDLLEFARSRQQFFDISSTSDVDKVLFMGSETTLDHVSPHAVPMETNMEVDTAIVSLAATSALQNKDPNVECRKASLSPVLSERGNTLVHKARDIGRESLQNEGKVKKLIDDNPATKRNNHVLPLPKSIGEKKTGSNGVRKLPHVHSDGTECVIRCVKIRERSHPSQAYFILPHDHGDGLKCIDKCVRLEAREQQRLEKERMMGEESNNGKREVRFNYIREDSLGKESIESFVSSEGDHNPRSCSVSPDVVVEKENHSDKKDESKSICLPSDKKYGDGKPVIAVRPRFHDEVKRKRHREKEDAVCRPVKQIKSDKDYKNKIDQTNPEAEISYARKEIENCGKVGENNNSEASSGAPQARESVKTKISLPPSSSDNVETGEQKADERKVLKVDDQMPTDPRLKRSKLLESVSGENVPWQQSSRDFSYEGYSTSKEQRRISDLRDARVPSNTSNRYFSQSNGITDDNYEREEKQDLRQTNSEHGHLRIQINQDRHSENRFDKKYDINLCDKNESYNNNHERSDWFCVNRRNTENGFHDSRVLIASKAPELMPPWFERARSCDDILGHHRDHGKVNGEEAESVCPGRNRIYPERGHLITGDGNIKNSRGVDNTSGGNRSQSLVIENSPRRRTMNYGNLPEDRRERLRNIEKYSRRRNSSDDRERRNDVIDRNVSKGERTSENGFEIAESSENRVRFNDREPNGKYSNFYSDNLRVTFKRNSNPSRRSECSNGTTEVSPSKVSRSIHSTDVSEDVAKFEEVTRRIRARHESASRGAKLIDSPATVNGRSVSRRTFHRQYSQK